MKIVDLTGKKFGKLKVISRAANKSGRAAWNCVCECGINKIVVADKLKSGSTKTCGCGRRNRLASISTTHGMSDTKEYRAWRSMINRCYNDTQMSYHLYGGRGIKVCDSWRSSFENFIEHVGIAPSRQHSLDRIDPNGDYEPSNVRWATAKQQSNNRRSNRYVKTPSGDMTVSEIAAAFGVKYDVIYRLVTLGRKYNEIKEYIENHENLRH